MPDPADEVNAATEIPGGDPAAPDASPPDTAAPGADAVGLAGPGERAAPARQQVAEHRSRRSRRRVSLRTSLTLGLFAIGVLGGAAAWRLLTPAVIPVDSYPALARAAEPAVAALVIGHLRANDARALGESLDAETLTAIRNQLSPLTTVDRVDFSSATSLGPQTLAAYVVEGRDPQGSRGVVGLILIIRDGVVVAE